MKDPISLADLLAQALLVLIKEHGEVTLTRCYKYCDPAFSRDDVQRVVAFLAGDGVILARPLLVKERIDVMLELVEEGSRLLLSEAEKNIVRQVPLNDRTGPPPARWTGRR